MSAAKVQRKATEAYQQGLDEVLSALNTDPRLGLSQAEAQARRKKFGRNELTAEKSVPAWRTKMVTRLTVPAARGLLDS